MPSELRPLAELAYDLWWSWHPGGSEIFQAVDEHRWEASGKNPVKLLRDLPRARLATLRQDEAFLEQLHRLHAAWRSDHAAPSSFAEVATHEHPVAFICAEFGLDAALPIYSGGLGILAGDVLKEASDLRLPMVGVGLFYRRGYFRQRLDCSGWQHEYWTTLNPEEVPMTPELDEHRCLRLTLRDRQVAIRIWRVQVGRVPLYLLDTDLPENDPTSRFITSTLYVGDRTMRLMQYGVLAIGGVRALQALGISPAVIHLNEGHASLASLELLRQEQRSGDHTSFRDALEAVRSRVVFTTHTPVIAGNEHYSRAEVEAVFGPLATTFEVHEPDLRDLTRGGGADDETFGVTELALRTSRSTNGVSRKHGETARAMWRHIWPERDAREVPITHVTNGVHAATWMAKPMRELLDRALGPEWMASAYTSGDSRLLDRIDAIDDAELWQVRQRLRARLVQYVRAKTVEDRLIRGESIAYAEGASATFDPDVLTIGFARRAAAYKRLHLLVRDPARAMALLNGRHRVQVVIAGRAHPQDTEAKELIKAIFRLKDGASTRVAFLEDYDLAVAHELVAGCDVWVNLPRPPLEASGTSGMKAALNGGLNLSVLDGWWCEAYEEGTTGWAIPSSREVDDETQDNHDAMTLFGLLEQDVLPTFYDRDPATNVPRAWIKRVKASLRRVASSFTTKRMVDEYAHKVWLRNDRR